MAQTVICQHCFSSYSGSGPCPNCGYDPAAAKKYDKCLAPFTELYNSRYLIGHVLGRGGFGTTYVALDLETSTRVAIKEYMPAEYSSRSEGSNTVTPFADEKSRYVFEHGKKRFVDEARTLLKLLDDPIVVDILKYFEENNTAYLVMEFLDGTDLKTMAKQNGGKIDVGFARMVFVTVASSLAEINAKGILHRDLSPDNIIYTTDDRIKLIDFGAARNYVSSQNKGLSILLKIGYAPPEQYNKNDEHGPWSDVYALCATFYHLVSGKAPVDALFRKRNMHQPTLLELGVPVTKKTSDVIEKGMALEVRDRYKNFMELLRDFDYPDQVQKPKDPPPETDTQSEPEPEPDPEPDSGPVSEYVERPGFFQRIKNFFSRLFGLEKSLSADISHDDHAQDASTGKEKEKSHTGEGDMHSADTGEDGSKPEREIYMPKPYVAAIVGNNLQNKMLLGIGPSLNIGRSMTESQFVISGDSNISRVHCTLRYDGQKIYLTDSSANGTFLMNNQRLIKGNEYQIKPGTMFYLASPNHVLIVDF